MNPLLALLDLSDSEKRERGLVHTPLEIEQQPDTWLETFDNLGKRQGEIRQFLTAAGVRDARGQKPTVFLIGAGTSDYIGHCLHLLLRQKWQCEVLPVASTSLLTSFSEYLLKESRYLWISFSRSGDSPEGIAVLERALAEHPEIRHLVVTCNARGGLARAIAGKENALGIVLEERTNDGGLAMTSSFSNMVLAGQILAHAWSIDEYEPLCDKLVRAGRAFLPEAAAVASRLGKEGYSRACFVGTAALAGTGMESALKLLELTAGKVKTMSQPTMALRHGPMAALDAGTLFVGFLSTEERRQRYELDLLREIGSKKLARTRVAVAGCGIEPLDAGECEVLSAPKGRWDIPDFYRPVLDVILGQLLGLFASLEAGLKPDSPSPNGVISRVVENVGIYP